MALLASYVEPLHGLSYVDPAYVDPRGAPYVDSLTWTLLMWTPLRGSLYVDFLTWTLLMWTPPTWLVSKTAFPKMVHSSQFRRGRLLSLL